MWSRQSLYMSLKSRRPAHIFGRFLDRLSHLNLSSHQSTSLFLCVFIKAFTAVNSLLHYFCMGGYQFAFLFSFILSGEVRLNSSYWFVSVLLQVYRLWKKAFQNRAVADTKCNEVSSRSHIVFRLKLVGENHLTGEKCQGIPR